MRNPKVAVIGPGRCGSTSLGVWLAKGLGGGKQRVLVYPGTDKNIPPDEDPVGISHALSAFDKPVSFDYRVAFVLQYALNVWPDTLFIYVSQRDEAQARSLSRFSDSLASGKHIPASLRSGDPAEFARRVGKSVQMAVAGHTGAPFVGVARLITMNIEDAGEWAPVLAVALDCEYFRDTPVPHLHKDGKTGPVKDWEGTG